MTTHLDTRVPPADTDPLVREAADAFAERLFDFYTGGMLTYMIDIGLHTGLLDVLARHTGTSHEIAERADLHERYVREWLGAMAAAEVVRYDPATTTYALPAAHAACLTGRGASNVAPVSRMITLLAAHVGDVARAFREGGGVPYERYRPEFTDVMDGLNRAIFDEALVHGWLPLADGLADRLAAGARVADVGCGTGHALVLLAQAFPASTFVGYDIAEEAIARARAEAEGLTNVHFEVRDAAQLTVDDPFDVVVAFDAIHDQAAPAAVLQRIHRALAPGGTVFIVDIDASSDLVDNIGHPLAPFLYATSVLHCLMVSLAEDGAGLGTVWGRQLARRMLADAGFVDVETHDAPADPLNVIHIARRP